MALIEFAQVLNDSALGEGLRESLYAYSIIEGVHLIGLAVSLGLLLFIDLRLLGLFLVQIPAEQIIRPLRPWLLAGFVVAFATGTLLFIASASKLVLLTVFYFKLLFIVLAGVNLLWFEFKWGRRVGEWGTALEIPAGVKFAGFASITFWSLVIITGRLIAYLGLGKTFL